jgi:excisionase family DNA binding protein
MNKKLLYSVDEVARMLGLSRATVYRMVRAGDIKCIKLSKKRVAIPVGVINSILGIERDDTDAFCS